MCLECGFYNGRQVVDMTAKKEAREARLQAKRERIKAEQGFAEEAPEENAAPAAETETPATEPAEKEEKAEEATK